MMDINKPSVWIPIAISLIVLISGGIVGAYHEFVTKERYHHDEEQEKADRVQIKTDLLIKIANNAQEIAGVSINQQSIGSWNRLQRLEDQMEQFYEDHGTPPYSDPKTQAKYERLKRKLEDERERYNDLQKKLK